MAAPVAVTPVHKKLVGAKLKKRKMPMALAAVAAQRQLKFDVAGQRSARASAAASRLKVVAPRPGAAVMPRPAPSDPRPAATAVPDEPEGRRPFTAVDETHARGERSQGRFRPARGGTSAGVSIATTLTYVVNSGANTFDIEIPDSPRLASSR